MHGGCFSYIAFFLFRVVRGGSPKGSPRSRGQSFQLSRGIPDGSMSRKKQLKILLLVLLTTKNNITV